MKAGAVRVAREDTRSQARDQREDAHDAGHGGQRPHYDAPIARSKRASDESDESGVAEDARHLRGGPLGAVRPQQPDRGPSRQRQQPCAGQQSGTARAPLRERPENGADAEDPPDRDRPLQALHSGE
jgi:hypothetical protein